MNKVCVGGTFEFLHQGHKALLEEAFHAAGNNGKVFIGLSSDQLTQQKPRSVQSYQKRKRKLEAYLLENNWVEQAEIIPITRPYGLTLEQDFDAIVVSPETKPMAEEINKKRKQLGKKEMDIIEVPYVMADDDKPIQSRRIKQGEIDEQGRLQIR